ncbi:hypothetical protein [Autumnicola psychrophila]|uniref:Uncharacterized protein n=1 Tax=Autumnicola psychrophila TaxID=3075592 RepID=A0ABU3DUC0_9FLAO|nr:hypothetical protein [Zunongwangia sp. F225]MDT0687302.1 hypothetical protein [Zunongwangia sp. F225]
MEEILKEIQANQIPFYKDWGFWISSALSAVGVLFSIFAFIEAKRAKNAANEAGKAVKIQTITIELTEIIQRLDKLDINITYQDARDFYSEINRKVRRILAPYKQEKDFEKEINEIGTCLNELKSSLSEVKPFNKNQDDLDTGNTVYYAVESEFSTLSGKLAELTGLLEQKNIE